MTGSSLSGSAMVDLGIHLTTDVTPTTPGGSLVVTCAALGSPVSELALVVALDVGTLRSAVFDGEPLSYQSVDTVSRWLSCLWWRTLFRLGHDAAHDSSEVESIATLASTLPFVPEDWLADFGRAAILRERRDPCIWPIRQRGEANGRAKLTQNDVDDMRRRSKKGATLRQLSAMFKVSPSRVHRIVKGDAW